MHRGTETRSHFACPSVIGAIASVLRRSLRRARPLRVLHASASLSSTAPPVFLHASRLGPSADNDVITAAGASRLIPLPLTEPARSPFWHASPPPSRSRSWASWRSGSRRRPTSGNTRPGRWRRWRLALSRASRRRRGPGGRVRARSAVATSFARARSCRFGSCSPTCPLATGRGFGAGGSCSCSADRRRPRGGRGGSVVVRCGGRGRRACGMVLLVVAYVAAGLLVLRTVPQPGVDVCTFQRESADALLAGANPYAITFADPYGPASGFYGDDVDPRRPDDLGLPVPAAAAAARAARPPARRLPPLAMLAAMTLAGVLLLNARPGSVCGVAAAALLLFTPRGFFVLEAGWIEPFVILGLAADVFFACRWRLLGRRDAAPRAPAQQTSALATARPTDSEAPSLGARRNQPPHAAGGLRSPIAAGLFLATKQYLVLAGPSLWLLPAFRAGASRGRTLVLAADRRGWHDAPARRCGTSRASSAASSRSSSTSRSGPTRSASSCPLAERSATRRPPWIPFAAALGVMGLALVARPAIAGRVRAGGRGGVLRLLRVQ